MFSAGAEPAAPLNCTNAKAEAAATLTTKVVVSAIFL
jgi:hypothetical protein